MTGRHARTWSGTCDLAGSTLMTSQPQSDELDLSPYYGKYVAWNLNRTRILASADDELEVARLVDEMKQPLEQVIFSYVPHPDEVFMGGAFRMDVEDSP